MSTFRKTIKYSKPSKDLDNKIKSLDENLKKTGVIGQENDTQIFSEKIAEPIVKVYDYVELQEEQELFDWRQSLTQESNPQQENIEEENTNFVKIKNLSNVENYISKNNLELINLREQIFDEIKESTLLNLPEIKYKITKVLEIYEQLQEGLLKQPAETKTTDPLTPLDQNFVTIEDLNRHYTLFINRVQEQLATVGGGGETRLKYLDDIVGIATNASAYDGKFLKYDHSLQKFEFVTVSTGGGTQDLSTTLGYGNTSSLGISVGISTFNNVVVGGATTDLVVSGTSLFTAPAVFGNVIAGGATTTFVVDGTAVFTGSGEVEPVRITQTGTGKALVVEDSENPDTTPFVVTTDGRLAIGVGAIGEYALEVDGGNARFVTGSQGDLIISHENLVSRVRASGEIQLALGANDSDAIRINLNNNVGIGSTLPSSKLDVVGNAKISGILTATGLDIRSSNFPGFIIRDPEHVGSIGTYSYFSQNYWEGFENGNSEFYIGQGVFQNVNQQSIYASPRHLFTGGEGIGILARFSYEGASELYYNNSKKISTSGIGVTVTGITSTTGLFVTNNSIFAGVSTVGLANTSTPPSNSQMSFELISNTNLRIKVRGTDGVLRSADITLS